MSRKRRIASDYTIKYVHETKGRIEYRPYIKKADQHDGIITDKSGFLKPPIKLGVPGDHPDKIYQAYLAAKAQITQEAAYRSCCLGWIWKRYIKSSQYLKLAPKTQSRNIDLSRIFDMQLEINGKLGTLSELHITSVNKPLFQSITEKRLGDYVANGKNGRVQVNREITLVSSMLSWGVNYLPELSQIGVHDNPLKGIKKLDEPKNERYVTDAEYALQMEYSEVYDYLFPVYELTYLLASRGAETFDLKVSECTEEGIHVRRLKGSKDNIIEWSPRLRDAYHAAMKIHETLCINEADPYLLPGRHGGKLNASSVRTAMQRVKNAMKADGCDKYFWSLKLLKSKGLSDSEDKHISGHKTEAMRNRYNTKVSSHKAVK